MICVFTLYKTNVGNLMNMPMHSVSASMSFEANSYKSQFVDGYEFYFL